MRDQGSTNDFFAVSRNALALTLGLIMCSPALLLAKQPGQTKADVEEISVQSRQASRQPGIVEQEAPAKAGQKKPVSEESGLSNKTMMGIGGAAVLLGVIAAGSGGSSSGSDSSSSSKSTGTSSSGNSTSSANAAPPKASQMVGVWQANAHSVEGLHYVGTYTLFSNGVHQYSIVGETGKHKSGSGRWDLRGYRLSLHNDSGTTYSGEFKNGNYSSLSLGTTVGWVLNLHR